MPESKSKKTTGKREKSAKNKQGSSTGLSIQELAIEYIKAHPEFAKNGGRSEDDSKRLNGHFQAREFTDFLTRLSSALDGMENALGWIHDHIKGMKSFIEDTDRQSYSGYFNEFDRNEATQKIYKKYRNMLASLSQLYTLGCNASDSFPTLFDDAGEIVCEPPYPLTEYVDVCIIDDCVVVKTPNLLSRYNAVKRASRRAVYEDYLHFYSSEIAQKLKKLDLNHLNPTKKIMLIVSVYTPKNKHVPDPDNLDTKKIVDAICDDLPGQDCAGYCTFVSLARFDHSTEPGTYFVVFEDTGEAIDIEKKISIVRERWRIQNSD